MTPLECEDYYDETGNRKFYAIFETSCGNRTIELVGEISIDKDGYPLGFRSVDCEKYELSEDDFDWSPW